MMVQYQQFQGRVMNFQKNPVRDLLGEIGGAVG